MQIWVTGYQDILHNRGIVWINKMSVAESAKPGKPKKIRFLLGMAFSQ